MPRIKGLGELDWDFRIVGGEIKTGLAIKPPWYITAPEKRLYADLLIDGSPIVLNSDKTIAELHFTLTLDKPLMNYDESASYEGDKGWFILQYELDQYLSAREKELGIPSQIRSMLVGLYLYFLPKCPAFVCYSYTHQKLSTLDITVIFDHAAHELISFTIRRPAMFLEAIARNMSKWYRQACEETQTA